MMTKLIVPAGLLVTLLATGPASAEVWCLRTPGESGGVCAFPSGRECARAATFMAFGGVCERQPLAEQNKPRTKTHSGSRTSGRISAVFEERRR
jgi:hypothetical protein